MTVCLFLGPTLSPADAAGVLEGICLPPVKQGDVYRAVELIQPRAIGIIDGYFQWVPAVWHKEILWAIRQGVHVFGAASMGALRASELAAFGMRGVGRIFQAYRDGVLADCGDEPFEDDDEVAVVHGPPESGYLAASEAMVNIRCTLADAQSGGVIDAATRARLVAMAKRQFFAQRSYELLLSQARAADVAEAQLAALQAWLPAGRVNQKRADALAMLEAMRNFLAGDPAPAKAGFCFEHTTLWDRAIAATRAANLHDPEETRVLDELRLDGRQWEMRRGDALRSLMGPASPPPATDPGELARRLSQHRGQPHHIDGLLEAAARIAAAQRASEEIPPALIERQILARMRDTDEFSQLRKRAADKLDRIAGQAELPDVGEFSDLQLLQLRDWYFSQVLGREMPDDVAGCVRGWGYSDLMHFHEAIFTEYVFRQSTGADAATAHRTRAGV